jgi:nitrogen PTS system EIIA component
MANEEFDTGTLAAWLHLNPSQIEKLASRGQIPCRRVDGQWRFREREINEWLEERIGASNPEELEQMELMLDSRKSSDEVTVSALIRPELIANPLNARTRNSVIERLCNFVADTGAVWEPDKFAEAVRARESLHPTALENGVALLHPRRPMANCLADPFLALGLTHSGIPFGGPRGVLTDVFFLIGSSDERQHLKTLARLSRLISKEGFLDGLRATQGCADACQWIRDNDALIEK